MNLFTKLLSAGLLTAAHVAYATGAESPASATSAADTKPEAVASSTGNAVNEKKICTTEAMTGSRFPRRVCLTQLEWNRVKETSVRTTRELQDLPTGPVEAKEGG